MTASVTFSYDVDDADRVYRWAKGIGAAVLGAATKYELTSNPVASRKPDVQSLQQKLAAG